MKYIYLALSISIFSGTLFSQVTDMGGPISWNGKTEALGLGEFEIMEPFNLEALQAEDEINDVKGDAPWRFGFKYETNYNFENSGVWTDLPSGGRMWQLGITCEEAQTINFIFEDFNLPSGAYLYLYDVDKTNRVGAYTSRNNRTDGLLGSELVHGQSVIIEYFEPASAIGEGTFTVANVIHGYRSLDKIQKELSRGLNDSGDCNVDVNCPLGDLWGDQIRSVAMIVVGGSGICTGALINNTCDDGTPYFLTANHCLGGSTGSWAFRFNWQSPPGTESCATTAGSTNPGPPYDQTANGATVLTSGAVADFALLEIDFMTVTDAIDWNCYYAGWDNSDLEADVDFAVGVHHPSGDVKKICIENEAPYHSTASGADVWWIDDWDEGVTEPGSSGSPLFNQDGRIIGQLYGGAAACSGTVDNDAYDYYGRFGVSWVNGVSDYLAPTSCGSTVTNDGWDPSAPSDPDDAGIAGINAPDGLICSNSYIPEVVLKNFGSNDLVSVDINYDIDGGTSSVFAWTGFLAPGASTTVTLPSVTTPGGSHVFNSSTSNPNGTTDSDLTNDALLSNYTATIGGELTTITINTDCWGEEIAWELFDDMSTLISDGGNLSIIPGGGGTSDDADPGAYSDDATISVDLCLVPGCYDFVIYDDYGDGMYGSQYSTCSVDGTYEITDGSGAVLASIIAADSDYGDSETNNFCVSAPCSGTFTSTTSEETCYDDCTGSFTLIPSGGTPPFTYDIGSGAGASPTFTGLCQDTYNVTVEDGDACVQVVAVTLSGPAEADPNATVTNVSCEDETDGEINAIGAGGTAPYEFAIDGTTFTSSGLFTGLAVGDYTITVKDDNGCLGEAIYTVANPSPISATADTSPSSGSDGSINLTVTGGTAPYTYSWTGPSGFTSTSEDLIGLAPGNYAVTITDANGCTATVTNISVTSNLGINDNENASLITVFPNPTNGLAYIQMNTSNSVAQVKLIDVTGRIVQHNLQNDTGLITLDLSDYANGLYFVQVELETEVLTVPLIVQH